MIRWGYYQRRGEPIASCIRIQRVRCKKCGRTTNVLPCFLLARRMIKDVETELANFTPSLLAKAFRGEL